ncbi:TPA: hypothetical protein KSJ92_004019, partial [Clostridioides difficile]|nr:hypothetical protein [Clostridioides difficile]HBH3071459.1 hypothetical protein [Clostridioides difficile]HBH3404637.1 hypothetical protein [Clostridioides difficile]HBH3479759.1 hypothetical protein [Clostridioides difficile]HBH3500558.1 hypothetical protein [Clostridioides difficile]
KLAKLEQTIKLFISPDIEIKAGSKLIINDKEYVRSGESAIYSNHQEIILELFKDKA